MVLKILVQVILLSAPWLVIIGPTSSAAEAPRYAKPNCTEKCGNVTIPFPFGMGEGCYLDSNFLINCTRDHQNRTYPLLNYVDYEVTAISVSDHTIKIKNPITFSGCGEEKDRSYIQLYLRSPFAFSSRRNVFASVACGAVGLMTDVTRNRSAVGGCLTICGSGGRSGVPGAPLINFTAAERSCNGVGCCQTTLPSNLQTYSISFQEVDRGPSSATCRYAFMADQEWFSSAVRNVSAIQEMIDTPVVMDWGVYHSPADVFNESFRNSQGRLDLGNAYCDVYDTSSSSLMNTSRIECSCKQGFHGSPYLHRGCQDIDECSLDPPSCGPNRSCINYDGDYGCFSDTDDLRIIDPLKRPVNILASVVISLLALFLLVGAWWLYKVVKKRRIKKQKQKFFKRNGGLLLQQQLSSGEVNVDKIKLFNSKELEKATEKFNANRILGQGGQGTVYKGMLTDGKIVAVKRPKSTVEGDKLNEFINEVVILSQINHRNVVKLLGCCLETEVPLLVYEFVPNGTLSQYIHDGSEDLPLTWETRLQIAAEIGGALAYLHSSASVPIYHRDIKSANILLDEKYRAKVADFGTSRSIAIDQTHLTTMVYGTFGYLDPEYFQSSQFTDKSDVYSFGVVLVELLTGKKPIMSVSKSERGGSLATCFVTSMEEDSLFDIVDSRVANEGKREAILEFANLAKRCLNLNGKRRPTMKEVASVLEAIQKSVKSSNGQQTFEADECERNKVVAESWEVFSTETWSRSYDGTTSSSAGHPLLSSNK